jgi:hypothetical protein
MTVNEKYHEIAVALNSIRKVAEDTDEELWARKYLDDAIVALNEYFEESEL